MANGLITVLEVDKKKQAESRITVYGSGQVVKIFRGNGATFRVVIRNPSGSIADLSDHANLNLSYMPVSRVDDAIATETAAIANATFTEAELAAGTKWHAEFTFSEADMNPSLDGALTKAFWLICYGTATGSGDEITHGGGTLTIIEDGTANTVATPDPPAVGVTAAQVLTIIEGEKLTGAEIKTAYEGEADTNAFTNAEKTKLAGVEAGAEVNPTDAEVKTAYEANANTNAFTDSEKAKLAAIDAAHYGAPLADVASLTALPEAGLTDKERRFVESEISDYFYDSAAVSGDEAPDDQTGGTGFWRKVPTGGDTAASIKTKYESNADTNAFTDTEKSKLASVESGAEVNRTAAEIKTDYESNADTNAFTDAQASKLSAIEAGAQVNPTAAAIKSAYESNANTNAYDDASKAKVDALSGTPIQNDGTVDFTARQKHYLTNYIATAETLASDTLALSSAISVISAQSGVTDTLSFITGGVENDEIALLAAPGHTITVARGSVTNQVNVFTQTLSATSPLRLINRGGVWYDADALALRRTITTVQAYTGGVQSLTTTFADVAGSSINYSPAYASSEIIYRFDCLLAADETPITDSLAHFSFFAAGTEQTMYRRSARVSNGDLPVSLVFRFSNTSSASKVFKIQAKEYSAVLESKLHETYYWDGAPSSQSSAALLTITEIPT